MINDEMLSEDKSVRWRGAYLSCSSEQIEKRLHEATRDGMDIVAQLETIKEAGYEAREDVSGVLEFMNWILSQIVVGLGFEAPLGELIAKELTLIDEYPIDEQNERINRLVDELRNLPVSSTGEAEAPRLDKLLPEKLIYQEDIVEQDIELEVESEDISSRHVTLNNPGVRAKLSYFVLTGNSWKAIFSYSIVSAYTKSRFVVLIQPAPNQPWKKLPYHFKWIVDEIEAAVSDTGQCRGDKLWVGLKKKESSEVFITWKFSKYPFYFLYCKSRDRSSFHGITDKGHTWRWKWCDGTWKDGNAWYWGP